MSKPASGAGHRARSPARTAHAPRPGPPGAPGSPRAGRRSNDPRKGGEPRREICPKRNSAACPTSSRTGPRAAVRRMSRSTTRTAPAWPPARSGSVIAIFPSRSGTTRSGSATASRRASPSRSAAGTISCSRET
ncbi:hypothetical protein BG36_01385 [Aquamicrobium defluvii]|uniref:Uncharacterized protein n=1 Tax=Aquamicrobium defluvii TaxID=69279 RepID=A0A011UWD2_9HYPH|nr:hypothetical protein BG36_01385 [Aquamicrobium defluvii]